MRAKEHEVVRKDRSTWLWACLARCHSAVVAVAVLAVIGIGVMAQPAVAATTSTPPYASSGTAKSCDTNTLSCTATVSADHNSGELSVELSAMGGEYYEPGACVRPPGDLRPCGGSLVRTGAYGRAWVIANHVVPTDVSAVVFTVTVQTDVATASGGSGSAVLAAWASQPGLCSTCSGRTNETIVSSPLTSSAPATTRTLQFTYGSSTGSVPAGPISVSVDLSGDARGLGLNEVKASARVSSVSATFKMS